MKTRRTSLRRLAAGAGALSLAMVGLAGTAAMADLPDGPVIGNIDPDATGVLNVHKFGGDPVAGQPNDGTEIADTSGLGTPLTGVEFTVYEVLNNGVAPDLTTPAGWDAIDGLTAAGAETAPWSINQVAQDVTAAGLVDFNLDIGLYLVKETAPGPNEIVSPVVPFLVTIPYPSDGSWLYDVHVYPKNKLNTTEPGKTVADPGFGEVKDSTVTWTINAPVPPIAADDTYDAFVITDQLDARLSVDTDDVVVELDGVELDAGTDYDITVDGSNLLTITLTGALANLTGAADQEVIVTLPTTVDEVTNVAEIANQANVNVNNSTKPTDEPTVYYGALTVNKFAAGDADNTLAGAKFELFADDGDGNPTGPVLASGTTEADGTLTFDGLWVGTDSNASRDYVLVETEAPAGYVLPSDPNFPVTIEVGEDNEVSVTVQDVPNTQQEGPNLPLTGSTGTLLFTIVGIGLIATGGVIAAVRHNRSKA